MREFCRAIFILLISSDRIAMGEPETTDRLVQQLTLEGPQAWDAMENEISHSNWDYTQSEVYTDAGKTSRSAKHVEGRYCGQCFLIRETYPGGSPASSVYARNSRYGFSLNKEDAAAPWVVTWEGTMHSYRNPTDIAYADLGGMLKLPWSISAIPLRKLIGHKHFSVRRAEKSDQDNDVAIEFSVSRPIEDGLDDLGGMSNGRIVLHASRQWAIKEYIAEYKNGMMDSVDLLYSAEGPPKLSRIHFKTQFAAARETTIEIDVKNYRRNVDSEAEFTLTAFGLPEYQEAVPNWRRFWAVVLNLGIFLLLLAFFLRRRWQER
jgi:hypothetical protein